MVRVVIRVLYQFEEKVCGLLIELFGKTMRMSKTYLVRNVDRRDSHDQSILEIISVGAWPVQSLVMPNQGYVTFGIFNVLWVFHDVVYSSTLWCLQRPKTLGL
jgi:hypothetical protein